jgi:hypothetical protein
MTYFKYPIEPTVPPVGGATEAKQDSQIALLTSISTGVGARDVVDELDAVKIDTSSTNIPASSALPLEIVAVLAANVSRIEIVEDIGEYIHLFTGLAGAEVRKNTIPLGGGIIELQLAAGERISMRAANNVAISVGDISMNFLG